jgi:Leucine-rich repeat (LRR) protein
MAFSNIITLWLSITSCKDTLRNKDNDDNDSLTGGAGDLEAGQVEIKVDPDRKHNVSFEIAAREISIDWGDGTVEETTISGLKRDFEHEYANANPRSIKINTESLIRFGIDLHASDGGQFNELRFGNCPKLKEIEVGRSPYSGNGQLTVLEINRAGSLIKLDCSGNKLTTLNVNGCPALTSLNCSNNQLTSLDVSKCPALTELKCYGNYACNRAGYSEGTLTSLNVKGCTALTLLDCSENQLTSLDASNCPALTGLNCSSNQLTSLNVNGCTALTELDAQLNQLTSLDVSECTALYWLNCYSNRLTSLDVSECTALAWLSCGDNPLTSSALNSLFAGLPSSSWMDILSCHDNRFFY